MIFEIPIRGTDTYHVIVVWDRWEGFDAEDRSAMILDAYRRFDEDKPPRERMLPRVTIVIGATPDGAVDLGILPYVVVPDLGRNDVDDGRVRELMRDEGAIETSAGTELRFPTLPMAREAAARLRARSPGIRWQTRQQVGRVSDFYDS